MDDLYKEIILEHYQYPNHRGKLDASLEAGEVNSTCGDAINLFVKVEKGVIVDAKFGGHGCAISMAAVDILIDSVIGKDIAEVQKMSGVEIEKMLGVELTPARKKCAYLGLEVLKKIKVTS